MTEIDLQEAKLRLSELVERAAQGEETIITRDGRPAAHLASLPQPARLASARGLFRDNPSAIGDSFDELPDDFRARWSMP